MQETVRNIAIFRYIFSGNTLKNAELEFGLSRERTRQVVAKMLRKISKYCSDNDMGYSWDCSHCIVPNRKHSKFLLHMLKKFKIRPTPPQEKRVPV